MSRLEQLDQLTEALAHDPDIDAVYLFGSAARGKQNPLSDIDVALLFESDRRGKCHRGTQRCPRSSTEEKK
jgi:predicted nucleotidyltransferase